MKEPSSINAFQYTFAGNNIAIFACNLLNYYFVIEIISLNFK
jgi:hypothetical protein